MNFLYSNSLDHFNHNQTLRNVDASALLKFNETPASRHRASRLHTRSKAFSEASGISPGLKNPKRMGAASPKSPGHNNEDIQDLMKTMHIQAK